MRWHRLESYTSGLCLCLRAVWPAMLCRRLAQAVTHAHTPSSAAFLPPCRPKGVDSDDEFAKQLGLPLLMSRVDLGKVGMSDMALKNEVTCQKCYTVKLMLTHVIVKSMWTPERTIYTVSLP